MEVVDQEPGAWFLLREGESFFLDANCDVSAVGFTILLRLTEEERDEYRIIGRAYIQYLAARVQNWPERYATRNIAGTDAARVHEAIMDWKSQR